MAGCAWASLPAATQPMRCVAIVLVAAVAAALGTARLGLWQLDRAAQKAALHQAQLARAAMPALQAAQLARSVDAAAEQQHRRVELEGRWLGAQTSSSTTASSTVGPVSTWSRRCRSPRTTRCWCSAAGCRAMPQATRAPAAGGHADRPGAQSKAASPSAWQGCTSSTAPRRAPIRQNLDVAAYARETGLALRPLVVVQLDGARRRRPAAPVAAGRGRCVTSTTAMRCSGSRSAPSSRVFMSGSNSSVRDAAARAEALGLDGALAARARAAGRRPAHARRAHEDAAGAAGVRGAGARVVLHLLRAASAGPQQLLRTDPAAAAACRR